MTINERFEQFLGVKRISQKGFAELTGFPTYSLSKIITGTTKTPKVDLVMVLMQHFPELNLRWLLLGEGEMFSEQSSMLDKTLLDKNTLLQEDNIELRNKLIKAQNRIIELLES